MPLSESEFFAKECGSMANKLLKTTRKRKRVDRYIIAAGLYSEAIKFASKAVKGDLIVKLAECFTFIPSHIIIDLEELSEESKRFVLARKSSTICNDLPKTHDHTAESSWYHNPMSMQGLDATLLLNKAEYFLQTKRHDRFIMAAGLYSESIRYRPFIKSIVGLHECFKQIPHIEIDLQNLPLPPGCAIYSDCTRIVFMENLFKWTLEKVVPSDEQKTSISQALSELQVCKPPPATVKKSARSRNRTPKPILPSVSSELKVPDLTGSPEVLTGPQGDHGVAKLS
jgi:hypothetical protein